MSRRVLGADSHRPTGRAMRASSRTSSKSCAPTCSTFARRRSVILTSRPRRRLSHRRDAHVGEFGVQARSVRAVWHAQPSIHQAQAPHPVEQAEHGQTMIYSLGASAALWSRRTSAVACRARCCWWARQAAAAQRRRHRRAQPRVRRHPRGRRHLAPPRRAATTPDGSTITDLGSTNGVILNGRAARGTQLLATGDRLELGSTEIVFELG